MKMIGCAAINMALESDPGCKEASYTSQPALHLMKTVQTLALQIGELASGSPRMIGTQNMISKRSWTANAFESAGVVFGLMMYCTSGCNASHELSCVR